MSWSHSTRVPAIWSWLRETHISFAIFANVTPSPYLQGCSTHNTTHKHTSVSTRIAQTCRQFNHLRVQPKCDALTFTTQLIGCVFVFKNPRQLSILSDENSCAGSAFCFYTSYYSVLLFFPTELFAFMF